MPTGSAPKPNRPSRGCVQRGGWVAAALVGGAGVAPPGSFTTVTNGGGQLKLLNLTTTAAGQRMTCRAMGIDNAVYNRESDGWRDPNHFLSADKG